MQDQASALRFYTEVLGFEKKHDIPLGGDRGVVFKTPPTKTEMSTFAVFDDTCGNWILLNEE